MIPKLDNRKVFKMILIDEFNKPITKIKESNVLRLKNKVMDVFDKLL